MSFTEGVQVQASPQWESVPTAMPCDQPARHPGEGDSSVPSNGAAKLPCSWNGIYLYCLVLLIAVTVAGLCLILHSLLICFILSHPATVSQSSRPTFFYEE